jgi:hypothetical protein
MIKEFTGFVLLMYANGDILEYTPKESMSDCLKTKRIVERQRTEHTSVRWSCETGVVKMKKIKDGWHPIQLLDLDAHP